MTPRRPVVAVIGGGIAGLAAAWELATGEGWGAVRPEVHLLEAGEQVGGVLRSAELAGRPVDLAADAFVARRPEATDLCRELGLAAELVAPGTSGASVWARGRLRKMPAGLNLGVPTRWWPLARSGILDPGESLRVARDLVQPHRGARGVVGDRAVGAIIEPRLGRPVVERLVDPLLGGIHAGPVDDLSAAATFPYLLAASLQPGSLMRRMRADLASRPSADAGGNGRSSADGDHPRVFWSLTTGTAGLARRLTAELERGCVRIRTGTSLGAIRRGTSGSGSPDGAALRWQLDLGGERPDRLAADGVVLAVPADVAAVQLAPHAPEAAGLLSTVEQAAVAVLTMAVPVGTIGAPMHGTGFLVPRRATVDGAGALLTAATYLGRKWPHLARPDDELIRVSVGRHGDDRHRSLDDGELLDAVLAELGVVLGLRGRPIDWMVTRYDRAFPQYRVGHLVKLARIEQSVGALGGVELAGAAYRGVGIPACIGSGRAAARRLVESLSSAVGTGIPVPPGNGRR